jgi:hypothetical protein
VKPISLFQSLLLLLLLACAGAAHAQTVFTFEDQQIPAGWTQAAGTSASWAITNGAAANGGYSLRSAPIGHSQRAAIAWSNTFEAGTLSFVFRMESESCCDYFELKIDGAVVYSASGFHSAWNEVRRQVAAGAHVIEWSYRKDSSVASGADAVFIDDVRFGAALPVALPLMQRPGALLVTQSETMAETYFPASPGRRVEASISGPLAFHADGRLFVADLSQDRAFQYDAITSAHTLVASNVPFSSGFVALSTQLLGGQSNYCGGYSVVFLASGNVFNSAPPAPCESIWHAAAKSGTDVLVLQENRLTRRAQSTPGAISQTTQLAYSPYDLAVDSDGSLWLLYNSTLIHTNASGAELERFGLDSRYPRHIAIREDGLIGLAGDGYTGFVRPDHGFAQWYTDTDYQKQDAVFVPGVVRDADGDTLPLWWELAYGLDPAQAADAALDADGDTLSNSQEFAFKSAPNRVDSDSDGARDNLEFTAGTNPQRSDSDGDGLNDGIELIDLGSNALSTDTDGDGMGDYYEFTNGLNLLVDDRAVDSDSDGLTNADEFQRGTRPMVADSDSDGLLDGPEVNTHTTDPLVADTDGDGLQDGAEVNTHATNPKVRDSDSDTLEDYLEVVTLHSNPNSADSDGDGMPDAWEHLHTLGLTVSNAAADADNDGLSNGNEYAAGTLPRVDDTDHDRLLDGAEASLGANPLSADSDGDLLPDGWEFASGFNPVVADSGRDQDGDGFSALEEVWSGTSDTQPDSHPVAQAWSTHQGNPRHTGYQPLVLAAPQPRLALQVATGGQAHPAVLGAGRLFFTQSSYFGESNVLVAVDERTGAEVWRKSFGSIFATNPPAFHDGRVYVQTSNHSSDTYLHAYDGASGSLIFKSPHAAQWERYLAPTVFGDYVYVNGGYYGGAYSFHRVTGAQQWFRDLAQVSGWTPSVESTRVYAFLDRDLQILERSSGALLGSIRSPAGGGWPSGISPLIGGYENVIVCAGNALTSFDIPSRTVGWSRNGCVDAAAGNGLVFARFGTALTAINELTGAPVWSKTFDYPLHNNLVVTRSHVIVSDAYSTFLVRLSDQQTEATIAASGEKTLTPEGRLAITGVDSIKVFALDEPDLLFSDSFE